MYKTVIGPAAPTCKSVFTASQTGRDDETAIARIAANAGKESGQ
jgi:hypothetical protein